jgi:hypothetical protein
VTRLSSRRTFGELIRLRGGQVLVQVSIVSKGTQIVGEGVACQQCAAGPANKRSEEVVSACSTKPTHGRNDVLDHTWSKRPPLMLMKKSAPHQHLKDVGVLVLTHLTRLR